nr:unnamed protein product [Digitaria exilis]
MALDEAAEMLEGEQENSPGGERGTGKLAQRSSSPAAAKTNGNGKDGQEKQVLKRRMKKRGELGAGFRRCRRASETTSTGSLSPVEHGDAKAARARAPSPEMRASPVHS